MAVKSAGDHISIGIQNCTYKLTDEADEAGFFLDCDQAAAYREKKGLCYGVLGIEALGFLRKGQRALHLLKRYRSDHVYSPNESQFRQRPLPFLLAPDAFEIAFVQFFDTAGNCSAVSSSSARLQQCRRLSTCRAA